MTQTKTNIRTLTSRITAAYGPVNLGGWSFRVWQRGTYGNVRLFDIITPYGWASLYLARS